MRARSARCFDLFICIEQGVREKALRSIALVATRGSRTNMVASGDDEYAGACHTRWCVGVRPAANCGPLKYSGLWKRAPSLVGLTRQSKCLREWSSARTGCPPRRFSTACGKRRILDGLGALLRRCSRAPIFVPCTWQHRKWPERTTTLSQIGWPRKFNYLFKRRLCPGASYSSE